MITSISDVQGFAKKLLPKTLDFGPGLNVVLGENGCGKSTLLRLLGAYTGCPKQTGWNGPILRGANQTDSYAERLAYNASCPASVTWDGGRVLHVDPKYLDDVVSAGQFEYGSTELSMMDHLGLLSSKASSGQVRGHLLFKQIKALADGPPAYKGPKSYIQEFEDYVQTKGNGQKATVLLDEPERGLDLGQQEMLWIDILPAVAQRYQVIATTHSVFGYLWMNEPDTVLWLGKNKFAKSLRLLRTGLDKPVKQLTEQENS